MKRIVTYAACLALVVGVPLLGYAQSSTRDDRKATTSKLSMSDQRFVKNAAQGNKAEVELGRLASERGSSDTVKQLGQKMVADHGKASDELAQLAQHRGVMLPTGLDAKHKRLYDRLAKLSGDQFDREWVKDMARDHDKDVKAFQKEAQKAKDPDVKGWAAKTLPVIQQHQQQVHDAMASVGGAASASPGSKRAK